MKDEIQKLASTIVNYSLNVQKKEKVLIVYHSNAAIELVKSIIDEVSSKGAAAYYKHMEDSLEYQTIKKGPEEIIDILTNNIKFEVENYDCIIYLRYTENEYESVNVPEQRMKDIILSKRPYNDIRVNERKWVLLNYPSLTDAYKAHMNYDDYKKYAFEVMNVDYKKMVDKIKPLKELMEKTDKVKMVGLNTDISFSIKGMPAIECCGTANIPDGEIYTAPIKDSVNGKITYNTASPYRGRIYNNVSLTFKNGKIVDATCDNPKEVENLNAIFNSDEGARYIGEFSFGLNPKILNPMGDILFDEKINGSIHFTPGACYGDCDNGNKSSVHWDLVWIQRPDYGGGEVYFDDVLIRKDGKFVLDELKELNNL